MRIPSGKIDQAVYFLALDPLTQAEKTGLSGFTVYRSRNGAAAVAYTTPTVTEISAANMPGVYALLIDEDSTIAAGSDSEEYCVFISQASMAPVTLKMELYRREVTSGNTLLVDGNGRVDVIKVAGTNQTAKDLGASATQTGDSFARIGAPVGASISADVAAVKTDTAAIKTKTDSLTFTVAGQVDSNVLDWKSAVAPAMTGDSFARLGAPAGASVSADVAAIKAVLPAALVGGRMDASIGAVAAGAIAAAAFAANALDAVWTTAVRVLTAGTNIALAKGVGVTGFNDLDAAGIRGAAGLASANLDTQLAAINAKTTNLPTDPADESLIIAATNTLATAIAAIPTAPAPTAAAIRAELDANSTKLDVAVSTRLATVGYTAPDNAGIGTISGRVDVAVSTRLAAADYVGPDNDDLTAIKAVTDRFTFTGSLVNAHSDISGVGAIEWTYSLTSTVDSAPIADVLVWVTSDLAGVQKIASGRTDEDGQVVFYLDAGTVYVWRQKAGFNFNNPDVETVAA